MDLDPTAKTKLFDLHQAFVVGRKLHRRFVLDLLAGPNEHDLLDHRHHHRAVSRLGLIAFRIAFWRPRHMAERLDVKHFELAEEFAGGKRIKSRTAQAVAQGFQQPRYHFKQTLSGIRFVMGLDAPDQIVHCLKT